MGTIKVLVVDDSVVVRRLVSDALATDPAIEVVGTAVDGQAALTKVEMLAPDVITMDIEMPRLDGVATVRRLRADGCRTPIIMFSTLTAHGASATLDALAAGASDYVTKPANMGSVSQSIEQVRTRLVPLVKALAPRATGPAAPRPTPAVTPTAIPALPRADPARASVLGHPAPPADLLVVASSTGGPEALARMLPMLPVLDVPVAIVQHMPPVFTAQLAQRLDQLVPFAVVEARDGMPLRPGCVVLAPGDRHLEVVGRPGSLAARLHQGPPENFCRPAADVLFRSAARATGARTLGVVLTGMGHDGRDGSAAVVAAGGSVLAQDEATCVVWGMPGAVVGAGLASAVLPLQAIPRAVVARVRPARTRPPAPATPRHEVAR